MKQKKRLRAILFDLVGVLVFPKKGYVPRSVNEHNAAHIEKLFNHVDDQKLISDIQIILGLTNNEIAAALPYIPEKFEMFTDLWKMIPDLHKKFRLGIINNGNSLALTYWKRKFDFSEFDIYVNSAQVKLKKPDPMIYLLACKKLSVLPAECIFMDDSRANIESARSLGMNVVLWNTRNRMEINLKSFRDIISALK